MRSSGAVITPEDFRRERQKRDNALLERIKESINFKWLAYINGFDCDYDPVPAPGQDE